MRWIKSRIPAWERDRYERRIQALEYNNAEIKAKLEKSVAYNAGLQEALRVIRRIAIHNEVKS